MARMHPSKITESFTAYGTASERAVYDKAKSELSDDFHVFHDITWDDPSLNDSKKRGQIDFVIVNPNYGFITVEVKGGRCRYEPDLRVWTTQDKGDTINEITDPFDQAATASRVIFKLLQRNGNLKNAFIPHHHVAIFPDSEFEKRDLRADVKGSQLLDRDSLFNFKRAIESAFHSAFPDGSISGSVGKAILNSMHELYGTRPLDGKVPAMRRIREASEKLIALTEDQYKQLAMFKDHKRLVIRGCAGSGKTMLALHKAKTLATGDKRILLSCFNEPLGEYLQAECESHTNILAGSFYNLCVIWLRDAGIHVEVENTNEWWTMTLPNLVEANLALIPHRFDALIIDEGQDFAENYWVLLELLLKDQEEGVFYIFADSRQNIYNGSQKYPMQTPPISLTKNIRNTNQIFDVVKRCCDLAADTEKSGVDGPGVQITYYECDADLKKSLEQVMAKLVSEHVTSDDVVILGTRSQARTVIKYESKIGPFTLVEKRTDKNQLQTMTVQRFKGLESPVVIVCELGEHIKDNLDEILYVGLTRASSMLIIMAEKCMEERIKIS